MTDPTPAADPDAMGVLYGGITNRRVTVRDLQQATDAGERWAMLTSYDMLSARIFDEAGVPVLLVGDSAGNNVLGYSDTVPVTVDEMLMLTRAVVRGTNRALVVGDLPFGSYQESVGQGLATAVRFLKEGGCQAVKLEGGARVLPQVRAMVEAGIPVMGHVGLTPQSVNTLGLRVQGRGDAGEQLLADTLALQDAGAFAVVLEAVPSDLGAVVSEKLTIPTVGIGAGNGTDAQVLVWTDLAGLTERQPKFVKKYADLRAVLTEAATAYADEVRGGTFPGPEHSYT